MVERLNKTKKKQRIIEKAAQSKLRLNGAKVMKTLRITANGVTKALPFDAHFGRNPNTVLETLLLQQNYHYYHVRT